MRDISCKLLKITGQSDTIGTETENIVETEIPIIKIEDVYAKEFYIASQEGFKPSLKLRISTLNYNFEEELIYMNQHYSIIRTEEITADEMILVCERKIKNVE